MAVDPNSAQSPQPERTDNVHTAPPTPPSEGQILETPEEARRREAGERETREDMEAGAAVAATGLGCLSAALMPWAIGGLVLLVAFLLWLFHGR